MPTGDGLLVRLTPTGATMRPDAFIALCMAARKFGNGVIEITSRASIQIRGLTQASVERFAATLDGIDKAFSEGPAVLCDSLSGLDPGEALDAGALAAELRRAMAAASFIADLGPKVSVTVDGGGALHLDAVPADLRLQARASGRRVCVHVAVGGNVASATPLGAVAAEHAVEAALGVLRVIAAGGQRARARDIVATSGAAAFWRVIADLLVDVPPPLVRPSADPVGEYALRDRRVAIGFGLAFGHADATALVEIARTAADAGVSGLRTAPGGALLVIGVAEDAARRLTDSAERLGFIVRAKDPRRRVVACAGAPICAAAEIPARELAPNLARRVAIAAADAPMVHVSGCAKGCACPRSVPLTVVGIDGQCGVVINGSARDRPLAILTLEELPGALSRLANTVERLRAADEGVAEVLSRLDRGRIARLIHGEATGA